MTHHEYAPPSPDLEREFDESRRWCQSEGREGRSAYLAFEEHVGKDLREAPLASAMLQLTARLQASPLRSIGNRRRRCRTGRLP